ncbi:MAG: Gfo/Idh/MocA family oxidoreductase [Alphaproteobacteria bacterium]|nr:Gfo/Idh/MocA family oxidoreductase [Alphaproteobacteria bacterium]
MSAVRVGVIGCGAIGAWHARILAERADAELAALVDTDGDRARDLGTRLGAPVWTDAGVALAETGLDAVVIATPEASHPALAEAAAAAGCALLIEKPVAADLAGIERIAAAVERTGVTLMAAHVERFETGSAQLVDALREGVCGRVVSICARRQFGPAEAGRFAGTSSTLRVLGVHDMDLVRWVHPAPVDRVHAVAGRGRIFEQTGMDDHVVTTLGFADGAAGLVESAWTLPAAYQSWPVPSGWSPAGNNRLEVFGDRGMLSNDMGLRGQQLVAFDGTHGFRAAGIRHQPVVHGRVTGALRDQMDHFLACVRDGTAPLVGLDDARRAIAVTEAAERSLATGAPVAPAA